MDSAIILYMVSDCCLSLYLNIASIRQGPEKMLPRSWNFFVTKRVVTLDLICVAEKCENLLAIMGRVKHGEQMILLLKQYSPKHSIICFY